MRRARAAQEKLASEQREILRLQRSSRVEQKPLGESEGCQVKGCDFCWFVYGFFACFFVLFCFLRVFVCLVLFFISRMFGKKSIEVHPCDNCISL